MNNFQLILDQLHETIDRNSLIMKAYTESDKDKKKFLRLVSKYTGLKPSSPDMQIALETLKFKG